MARSFHSNRSQVLLQKRGYIEWSEIFRKRQAKTGVRETRRHVESPSAGSSDGTGTVITFSAHVPEIFFPASERDVRNVLFDLPRGVADGLRGINFSAGTHYVNEYAPLDATADPILRRRGKEVLPGVYEPSILGVYDRGTSQIDLFGYVKVSTTPLTVKQAFNLRFEMLKTLVHEVAHHFDRTRRMAGDRLKWDVDKAERYADVMTRRWSGDVVVPYLNAEFEALDVRTP